MPDGIEHTVIQSRYSSTPARINLETSGSQNGLGHGGHQMYNLKKCVVNAGQNVEDNSDPE